MFHSHTSNHTYIFVTELKTVSNFIQYCFIHFISYSHSTYQSHKLVSLTHLTDENTHYLKMILYYLPPRLAIPFQRKLNKLRSMISIITYHNYLSYFRSETMQSERYNNAKYIIKCEPNILIYYISTSTYLLASWCNTKIVVYRRHVHSLPRIYYPYMYVCLLDNNVSYYFLSLAQITSTRKLKRISISNHCIFTIGIINIKR